MKKNNLMYFTLIVLFLSLPFLDCRKSASKIVITDLGFSMVLPSGWVIDAKDSTGFYEKDNPDDNLGWIADFPLEPEESLNSFIDSLLTEEQVMLQEQKEMLSMLGEEIDENEFIERKIISRENKNISGYDAVLMISEFDFSIIELFIRKGDNVIIVSFRTITEDFSEYEPIFHKAIGTIVIK